MYHNSRLHESSRLDFLLGNEVEMALTFGRKACKAKIGEKEEEIQKERLKEQESKRVGDTFSKVCKIIIIRFFF